jgi:diamine N-acetyltransferase
LPTVRQANLSDARRQLAQLAERTFRDTFGAVNTAEDMNLHCQTSYSEALQTRDIANPRMMTLLVEEGERLIGFAQLCWEGAPACVVAASPGEIRRFYLDKGWHGKGIAQALMKDCIEELNRRGSDVAWLGVWEHNPRAVAFYRKFGFVEVGEHIFPLGRDPQRDIVMARPVVAS